MAHPFTITMLQWFRENGRQLPWRETRDPYAIWLSEVILQQTRIQQGTAYWQRFMDRWPRVEDLASATEDEVLRMWQGLGYYSRARNLHTAARQIVELGHFPNTIEEIRKLKGVGDYTAAAIGSIAFDLPSAVVDGNVYRVLARHFGIDTPINTSEGKKSFTTLAQELLPEHEASSFNQAMMDFGAIQCTPQSPRCLLCPLAESCVALREGRVEDLPVKLRTLKVKTRHLIYIYIRCKGMVAIHRRGDGDIWQGLWEPVVLEARGERQEARGERQEARGERQEARGERQEARGTRCEVRGTRYEVREMLEEMGIHLPLTSQISPLKKNVKHVLTHRILLADFYLLECEVRPPLPEGYLWVAEEELDNYGVPRLVEILFEAVANHQNAKK